MKKFIYLLPMLFSTVACIAQAQPTPNVTEIVNATLTAIAQNNLQNVASQPTFTPAPIQGMPTANQFTSVELHYYWPLTLPEGFTLDKSNSGASNGGFSLVFINPSTGTIELSGGDSVNIMHCAATDAIPQIVRGFDGCFPQSTGGGFSVQWTEAGVPYSVGGAGLSRDLALQIAEQLDALDMDTWQARLMQ